MKDGAQLPLTHCPHCEVSNPLLHQAWSAVFSAFDGAKQRAWTTYRCMTCGGIVLTVSPVANGAQQSITTFWPTARTVSVELPSRAYEYLRQAIASRRAPSGAIVLAASAVDSMLKDKGYKDGNLYSRIDLAATAHLITAEMAEWAHEIRLDANDQRHADEDVPMPTETEADKAIQFAEALGEFLYVLPAMVKRGRRQPVSPPQSSQTGSPTNQPSVPMPTL